MRDRHQEVSAEPEFVRVSQLRRAPAVWLAGRTAVLSFVLSGVSPCTEVLPPAMRSGPEVYDERLAVDRTDASASERQPAVPAASPTPDEPRPHLRVWVSWLRPVPGERERTDLDAALDYVKARCASAVIVSVDEADQRGTPPSDEAPLRMDFSPVSATRSVAVLDDPCVDEGVHNVLRHVVVIDRGLAAPARFERLAGRSRRLHASFFDAQRSALWGASLEVHGEGVELSASVVDGCCGPEESLHYRWNHGVFVARGIRRCEDPEDLGTCRWL